MRVREKSTELSIMFGDKIEQMTRFKHPHLLSFDSCPIQLWIMWVSRRETYKQASKNNHSVKEAQVKPRSIRLQAPVLNCSDVKESQSWTNDATIAPAASHCPHVAERTGRLWFGVIRSYSPLSSFIYFLSCNKFSYCRFTFSFYFYLYICFSKTYFCVTCTKETR